MRLRMRWGKNVCLLEVVDYTMYIHWLTLYAKAGEGKSKMEKTMELVEDFNMLLVSRYKNTYKRLYKKSSNNFIAFIYSAI